MANKLIKRYVFASDFDKTLTFNATGYIPIELLGFRLRRTQRASPYCYYYRPPGQVCPERQPKRHNQGRFMHKGGMLQVKDRERERFMRKTDRRPRYIIVLAS